MLNFAGVNPIRALYWSAVVNGVVAVPVLALMVLMAGSKRIMGEFTVGAVLTTIGWLAVGLMAASIVAMVAAIV